MKKSTSLKWERWPGLMTVTLFLAMIGYFYREVIFGNSIFVFVDASRFFFPLWKWGAHVLAQGIIPLWNPDAQFGTPYLADPQMAYAYPPVPVLYSFLSPVNAFAALIILHHLWALLGFWFFARGQGFSVKASLFGAFAFGFSLHLVCSSWTPVALMTISWLPWVFAAAERVFREEKGGFLFLSFAWAMQLSAGYPVLVYLTGLALGLHYLWKTWRGKSSREDRKRKKPGRIRMKNEFAFDSIFPTAWWLEDLRWMGGFATAGFTAVVYNLVWGLPFAEFLGQSNYENGAGKFHDLQWLDLGTALSPFLQGHPLLADYHGPHYWVSTYYIGLPVLCLLFWGVARRVYQKTSPGLFLAFLVLSLGVLGAGKILKAFLPGYNLVVHSGFWISLLLLYAVWMAMESMEAFLLPKEREKGPWPWLTGVLLVCGGSFLLHPPLFPLAFWLSTAGLATAVLIKRDFWRWCCLAAALLLSLGPAASSLNILLDRGYYEKSPSVLAGLHAPGRLFFTPPLMGEAVKLQGVSMAQAYEDAKQMLYPNWPLAFGKELAPIYNTIQLKSSFAWTFNAFQYSLGNSRRILDYLDVRYVFGQNQFKDFKRLPGGPGGEEVSENPTPMAKWFAVEKAVPAEDSLGEDFAKADREGMDFRKDCFVGDSSAGGTFQPRNLSTVDVNANQVLITAVGKGKALLASSETDYPGWKAWVSSGGRWVRRPLLLVNHAFRGLVLEEGENDVQMVFAPESFRLGLFFCLSVFALWTFLLLKRTKP